MDLHSFGYAVKCSRCGNETNKVYAQTALEARAGKGVCDSCHEKIDREVLKQAKADAKQRKADVRKAAADAKLKESIKTKDE